MLKLNGTPVSGATARIAVGPFLFNTIQGINFKEAMDHQPIGAVGSIVPIDSTDGDYSAEGDLEALLQEIALLRKALAEQNAERSWGKQKFDVLIVFDNGVDPAVEVKLVNCKLKGNEDTVAKGTESLKTKAPMFVHWIERDGMKMAGDQAFEGLL